MTFPTWEPATHCTGHAEPGAVALMKAVLRRHPKGHSLGIYSCRNVRGGSTTSAHGEGRALDVGFPMVNGRGSKDGYNLVKDMIKYAGQLGVQAIIYDRKIWSKKSPGGRPYTGAASHYDHVHIEMTREKAASLTAAKIQAIFQGSKPAPKPTPSKPAPKPTPVPEKHYVMLKDSVRPGKRDEQVKFLQSLLVRKGYGPIVGSPSTYYGEQTEAAVRRFHKANPQFGTASDSSIGPKGFQELQR